MVSSLTGNGQGNEQSNYTYLIRGRRRPVVNDDFMRLNRIFAALAITYLTEYARKEKPIISPGRTDNRLFYQSGLD